MVTREAVEVDTAAGFVCREAKLSDPADQQVVIALMLELQQPGRARYGYHEMDSQHVEETKRTLLALLSSVQGRVFFAFSPEGAPIGIAVCQTLISTWKLGRILNLQDFYVRVTYRNRGVGSALLELLETTAERDGYVRFNLETQVSNVGARRLYARRGYKGTDPSAAEEAVLQMRFEF